MDGLASSVFFKDFACCWNLKIRSASTIVLLPLPNSACIPRYDLLRGLVHLHCATLQRIICESSRAPAFWRNDQDVSHQNILLSSIFQGRLVMFTGDNSTSKRNVNVIKNMSILRGKSRDSRQMIFLFHYKARVPKLHFYPVLISVFCSCISCILYIGYTNAWQK